VMKLGYLGRKTLGFEAGSEEGKLAVVTGVTDLWSCQGGEGENCWSGDPFFGGGNRHG